MNSVLSFVFSFTLLVCALICLTGCYRMPTENDFSVVPTTNNPAVTCEKNTGLIPGMGY
jgi:hypothetical protein